MITTIILWILADLAHAPSWIYMLIIIRLVLVLFDGFLTWAKERYK